MCDKCNKPNCGCDRGALQCHGGPEGIFESVKITSPLPAKPIGGKGCSNRGKFFDLVLEDFSVPSVGGEVWMHVCEGALYRKQQFIGIMIADNRMAFFRVTDVKSNRIKLLNGCDRSTNSPILDNPEPGFVIKTGSMLYAVAPQGCMSGLSGQVLSIIKSQGSETISDLISEMESICLTSVPDIGESEVCHIFGGTAPECPCAPDVEVSSCLRKINEIYTNSGGRSLSFPNIPETDGLPVEEISSRIAFFVGPNRDLAAGPSLQELRNCSEYEDVGNNGVPAIIVCNNGEHSLMLPQDGFALIGESYLDPDDDTVKTNWVRKVKDTAVLRFVSSGNGGSAVSGNWNTRPINEVQYESADIVDLIADVITIKKPGRYLMQWYCMFNMVGDCASRMINAENASEVYPGAGATARVTDGPYCNGCSIGYAGIVVPFGETKKLKMEYRVETTKNNDGLGRMPNFGGDFTYAQVLLVEI